MLWAKESNRKNALYVDLLKSQGGEAALRKRVEFIHLHDNTIRVSFEKDDAISLQKRKEGNIRFGQGEWANAMEMYNESLLYAEKGSNNIRLAYANRSACFFKLKRYNECLIDIEMAEEAGYPADLMPKLDRRKDECLKSMEENTSLTKSELELSFDPDERFPCMANVLKIEQRDGEPAVIATEDIDVGQTITMDRAFITFLTSRYGLQCNICAKEIANLVPCKNCNSAMFCSKECENSPIHKHECRLRLYNDSLMNFNVFFGLRSCLSAIDMFSTAEEMMHFVEKCLQSYSNELPVSTLDTKSGYNLFLKLPTNPESNPEEENAEYCFAYETYSTLMNFPHVKRMFSSKHSRRFLMHLIRHHYLNMERNLYTYESYGSSRVGLILPLFEHSCAPNVIFYHFNGNTIFKAIRPVKAGENLMVSKVTQLGGSKQFRQKLLWDQRRIICKCSLCSGVSASTTERNQLTSDPDFQCILSEMQALEPREAPDNNIAVALQPLIEKCENLLRKYDKIEWCGELGRLAEIYKSSMLWHSFYTKDDYSNTWKKQQLQ